MTLIQYNACLNPQILAQKMPHCTVAKLHNSSIQISGSIWRVCLPLWPSPALWGWVAYWQNCPHNLADQTNDATQRRVCTWGSKNFCVNILLQSLALCRQKTCQSTPTGKFQCGRFLSLDAARTTNNSPFNLDQFYISFHCWCCCPHLKEIFYVFFFLWL